MLLILTEKPSAARNFEKALGKASYNGEEFKIVAARGHLLRFCQPENQVNKNLSERYKKWSLTTIPWDISDIKWRKEIIPGCKDVLQNIKKEMSDVSEVVIATDVDPSGEGELLAWEILLYCKWRGNTSRMYFADESPKSIQKAFVERKQIRRENDGDYYKGETRSRWDFLSMQFTRIATCIARQKGFNTVVRQGRLKSVMVYLVGEQLKAIKEYKKVPFYEVRFKDENGNVFSRKTEKDDENKFRFSNKMEVNLNDFLVGKVILDSKTKKSTPPGKLLDLAGLSAILATKGYKPKEILDTYQKMYEDQIVSYPRTEDKKITLEQFNEMLPLIDDIADVVGIDKNLLTHRISRKTHIAEGCAHGANRPGCKVPESLETLMKYGKSGPSIYELVARNFLAMFAEDYIYINEKGHIDKYPEFIGTVNIPVDMGYKKIFDSVSSLKDEEDEKYENHLGEIGKPFIFEGANTKPQKPTMKWLKNKLEKYDVGTGATRTSILADITAEKDSRSLMIEKKGVLDLTDCGKVSYALLKDCKIASPSVTEELNLQIKSVGEFKADRNKIIQSINDMLIHDMEKMKANLQHVPIVEEEALGKCPKCGKDVFKIKGKSSTFYSCRDYNCKFYIPEKMASKNISELTVKTLLEKGETNIQKGFKSKSNKTFNARLRISGDKTKVEFVFE